MPHTIFKIHGKPQSSRIVRALGAFVRFHLKAYKTHGFNKGIAINVYPLDIPSIEEAAYYRNN